MIALIQTDYEDILGIKMSGKLKATDYDKIIPLIENKLSRYGKINLYCEMRDLETPELAAIWEDLKFDVKHFNDFNRVAMVGDQKWMEWATQFTKPFTSAKVRYFDANDRPDAMAWASAKGLKV